MTWSIFSGTDDEWDDVLQGLNSTSPFALSRWASARQRSRWRIARITRAEGGAVVSALQVLWFRKARLFTVAWVPGGVAGRIDFSSSELLRAISSISSSPASYIRIAHHTESDPASTAVLSSHGWVKAKKSIGAEETILLQRTSDLLANKAALSSNWARNLERGRKRSGVTEVWANPNPLEVHDLMSQMSEFKREKGPASIPTAQSLDQLFAAFKDQLVVVHTRNEANELVAVRGAFVIGSSAWDAIAAANAEARKSYASYNCAWKLLEILDSMGVERFDLAGVDPINNEGVYNFKKGLGGRQIKYLGEWDATYPHWIRPLVGTALSRLR